jgi:hypothetical protein
MMHSHKTIKLLYRLFFVFSLAKMHDAQENKRTKTLVWSNAKQVAG